MKINFIGSIILKALFLGYILGISNCPVNFEYGDQAFRRIKTSSDVLITGSEIERAVGKDNWNSWGGVGMGECNLRGKDIKIVRKTEGVSAFYKVLIMHLLDEYFVKTGEYSYSHMPVPLTFSREDSCYYYMYIKGHEGFYWQEKVGPDNYDIVVYELAEFREWDRAFQETGIKVDTYGDIVSLQDSGSVVTSKNYILDEDAGIPRTYYQDWKVIYPPTWKAIDVDSPFYKFDKDKFEQFLSQNRNSLASVLGVNKLALLELAYIGYTGFGKGLSGNLLNEFNQRLVSYQQEVLQNYLP